jgi:hypothetical protein
VLTAQFCVPRCTTRPSRPTVGRPTLPRVRGDGAVKQTGCGVSTATVTETITVTETATMRHKHFHSYGMVGRESIAYIPAERILWTSPEDWTGFTTPRCDAWGDQQIVEVRCSAPPEGPGNSINTSDFVTRAGRLRAPPWVPEEQLPT